MKDIIQLIEAEIITMKSFWGCDAYFSAIVRYSNIYCCLKQHRMTKEHRNIIMEQLNEITLSDAIQKQIVDEYLETYNRINHVIGIGDEFNDDEFLLFFTLYTQLDQVERYMKSKQYNIPIINFREIREEIIEVGNMKINQRAFQMAINQIQGQNKLAIDSFWLTYRN